MVHRQYSFNSTNTLGVTVVQEVEPTWRHNQMRFIDIPPDAVKIGMVGSSPRSDRTAKTLCRRYCLDPVMVATSGSPSLPNTPKRNERSSCSIAMTITPNLPEGSPSGKSVSTKEEMASVAAEIGQTYGTAVLLKGGHRLDDADDYLYTVEGGHWYTSERIDNPNAHGTGCTLSSALACNLAVDTDLPTAVERAKGYVTRALKANLNLGRGRGPLNHMVEPF